MGELLTPPAIVACWGEWKVPGWGTRAGGSLEGTAGATIGALLPGDADAPDLGHTRRPLTWVDCLEQNASLQSPSICKSHGVGGGDRYSHPPSANPTGVCVGIATVTLHLQIPWGAVVVWGSLQSPSIGKSHGVGWGGVSVGNEGELWAVLGGLRAKGVAAWSFPGCWQHHPLSPAVASGMCPAGRSWDGRAPMGGPRCLVSPEPRVSPPPPMASNAGICAQLTEDLLLLM